MWLWRQAFSSDKIASSHSNSSSYFEVSTSYFEELLGEHRKCGCSTKRYSTKHLATTKFQHLEICHNASFKSQKRIRKNRLILRILFVSYYLFYNFTIEFILLQVVLERELAQIFVL